MDLLLAYFTSQASTNCCVFRTKSSSFHIKSWGDFFKADGPFFSETFRSQTEDCIQLQPSSLIGILNHFFCDCCIFSCNRHWLNFSAVLWSNVVGYLLHAPSVLFGQKQLFNSSSAEPLGQTRDLYCILNYFSCLFLDPQSGVGQWGVKTRWKCHTWLFPLLSQTSTFILL